MTPSVPRPWFTRWFTRRVVTQMERTFGRVEVAGLAQTQAVLDEHPVLFVANHTAWWDPMVAIATSHAALRSDPYAMMDERNLARLRFFAFVGAFGVDPTSRRDGARSIRYAASLLDRPGRAVWVFAQGQERPAYEPIVFRAGAARIASLSERATTIPVGLRYTFGPRPKPDAFVAFGPPLEHCDSVSVAERVAAQEQAVTACLRRIDAHQLAPTNEFELWLGKTGERASLATWLLDRWAGRALAAHQKPVLADGQRAIAPANASRTQSTSKRDEQQRVGQ